MIKDTIESLRIFYCHEQRGLLHRLKTQQCGSPFCYPEYTLYCQVIHLFLMENQHQSSPQENEHIRKIEDDARKLGKPALKTEIIHHASLCQTIAKVAGSAAQDHGKPQLQTLFPFFP